MQFRQKLAKAIRVISAPPFAAAAFALILYFNPAGAIVRRDQLVACLLGLSVGPVLAYPISAALHTGREKQRVIAMYISLLSYGILLVWSLICPNGNEFRFVCMTYFMSVIMLIVFNRLLHIRSSGHSCSVSGPGLLLCIFFGAKWIPGCAAAYALIFWASVETKRHTPKEFILGSVCLLHLGTRDAVRCGKRLALERIVYSNVKNRHLPEWRFFYSKNLKSTSAFID